MHRSASITWNADRIKLLDKFASEVADKKWEKVPYKFWRAMAHTSEPTLIIKRVREYDPEVPDNDYDEYSLEINKIGLTGTAENSKICTFRSDDKSFGSFLDNVFYSPMLTSKIVEAKNDVIWDNNTTAKWVYDPTLTAASNINPDYLTTNTTSSYTWNYDLKLTEEDVKDMIKEAIDKAIDNEKEKDKMDTSNLFNFDFGPASSGQFRMSPYGLAVRTQANGWVAYNAKTGELMDVDILNFDISKMIYKMPVALTAIKPGDILMHCGKPVFVREVTTGSNTVHVIDYTNATVAGILPVKSPFGFNFFTKVCPLFNFDQASANNDNPFGNMLPFLMLNGEKDGSFDPTLLFMASAMTGGNIDFASNPMMLYCLMNRSDKGDILPFLMMMNGNLTGMGVSTPTNSTPTATATA